MPFIADKDMIEALPPDAPAEALSIGVLPGRPGRNHHHLATPVPNPLSKDCPRDTIPSA